ncbi:hypothetical protein N7532_006932 [Penicillium argentinense]|uniref:Uncharacterized protein n=1 Tax=Penicillium argentinense TaxID=1131581 RepID=A0A9W9KBR1_9EURO|nr:uncharacterized protein N7532_006932 [Penicillium argentinense]KAJ5099931.1 hypothetical protein N7532_006932 [Penicillium argentinense]
MGSDRKCYFPSGAEAPGNVPCSKDTVASCCGEEDICLSNGLCLNVGHQPYVLSRGACTSDSWATGCAPYCTNATPHEGASIINLTYQNGTAEYCCGTPVISNDAIVCPDGDSTGFTVPSGTPLAGAALLFNVSSFAQSSLPTSTSNSTAGSCESEFSTCHQTAIGVGVGVSLGVVAIISIMWALLERARATKRSAIPFSGGNDVGGSYGQLDQHEHRPGPVELGSLHATQELDGATTSELMAAGAPMKRR